MQQTRRSEIEILMYVFAKTRIQWANDDIVMHAITENWGWVLDYDKRSCRPGAGRVAATFLRADLAAPRR